MSQLQTVLVVDDDSLLCKMFGRFFAKWGISTIFATSIAEARQAFMTHGGTLAGCLIDVRLGAESGELLASEFLVSIDTLQIVLMSGIDMSDLLVLGHHERVVFLKKPFLPDELRRVVQTHILDCVAHNIQINNLRNAKGA